MNKFNLERIEPKILPLVDSINRIGLFRTISSCQGHYEEHEQELMDRNKADVRFKTLDGVLPEVAEHFITYLMTEFNKEHGFVPILLTGYKLYAPHDDYEIVFCFVINIEPFDRFDDSIKKGIDTDIAILKAAIITDKYTYENKTH